MLEDQELKKTEKMAKKAILKLYLMKDLKKSKS